MWLRGSPDWWIDLVVCGLVGLAGVLVVVSGVYFVLTGLGWL